MTVDIAADTIEFCEDDYWYRGTRARVGTFDIIAIDLNHPNYGYFTEFMAFWRAPHIDAWQPIAIHRGSWNIQSPNELVHIFPRFCALFEEEEE